MTGLPVKLYTTLNDSASIQTPKSGTGPGTHNPSSAFVTGMCGAGFLLDAAGEYVSYPGSNIKLASGTIDFWYVPDDPETDPRVMHFFGTSELASGGIKITKLAGGEGNYFEILLVDAAGADHRTQVSPDQYSFVQGTPVRVTVAWSSGATPVGAPAVRVWFDKVEIQTFVTRAQYPIAMPLTAPTTLFVGAESTSDPTPANGAMDDFKIYGAPFAPQ